MSQGAAPDRARADDHRRRGPIIGELAGKPALEKLRETIEALTVEDLRLVQGGLLMGIVIDPNKPDYVQGDFLVRGLVGADPDTGQVAVGHGRPAGPGRAAARARRRERRPRPALGARARGCSRSAGATPAGALLISCNGRGAGMFGQPTTTRRRSSDELGGAPAAGFFAAGEIGPVGGEYFVHGFTATVAVFA